MGGALTYELEAPLGHLYEVTMVTIGLYEQ
jgi:hypothetical protein